jgi:pectin methylesterase-like acyl-CoA thioesterase
MSRKLIILGAAAVFVCAGAGACFGATITVNWDGSGDYTTIQAGIDAAAESDTVIVGVGTYVEHINFGGKNITLTSLDPMDPNTVAGTVIDGNDSGCVVTFSGSENEDCVLRGFTITNGYGHYTAGIYGGNSHATIEHCVLTHNNTSGYFYDEAGVITFANGIIFHCKITNNTGIGLYRCYGTITDCIVSENNGLGLSECNAIIDNCMITGNTGGGISGCDELISNCVVADNGGSGLSGCDARIKNCLITGNHSDTIGGGLRYCDGEISNCTIFGNTTAGPESGSGIAYCYGAIRNCIIWDNEILMYQTPTPGWLPSVFSYCCVEGLGETVYLGNFGADPLFVDPNNGDFHLKSEYGRWDADSRQWIFDDVTSPCVDAGDPLDTRWKRELWPFGERVNIGVYGGTAQASMSANKTGHIADLNHDESVNQKDFSKFADDWMRDEVLMDSDLDRDNDNDMDDLFIFINNWLWVEPSLAYDWNTNPGDGSIENPYQISEPYQLNAIGLDTNLLDKSFVLTADIDMSDYIGKQYRIIGTSASYPFTGIFDGNDLIIRNLTYSNTATQTNYAGLFGYIENAVIKNLGIENVFISTAGENAGGLAGSMSDSTITNCYSTGTITIAYSSSSENSAGGIVGAKPGGSITNCYSSCAIDILSGGYCYGGGLVGRQFEGSIADCYSTGAVTCKTSTSVSYAGGLVGHQWNGSIVNCFNTGLITATSSDSLYYDPVSSAGGLVGIQFMGFIANCYNTGEVASITPHSYSSTTSYAGGLAGRQSEFSGGIEKCYSTGLVFASGSTDYQGGLLGSKEGTDDSIAGCFWDIETSGTTDGVGDVEPDPSGVTGKTTEEMMELLTFTDAGWDFVGEDVNGTDDIWWINEGITYPYLWWE